MTQESLTCYSKYNYMHCLWLNLEQLYSVILIAVAPISSPVPPPPPLPGAAEQVRQTWPLPDQCFDLDSIADYLLARSPRTSVQIHARTNVKVWT